MKARITQEELDSIPSEVLRRKVQNLDKGIGHLQIRHAEYVLSTLLDPMPSGGLLLDYINPELRNRLFQVLGFKVVSG